MTLFSALEDLQETTLKAVTGCLRRLEYLSGLRDKDGEYGHWGLGRVYGDFSAKKALAQAHRATLSKVLATPIRELVEDAKQSGDLTGLPPAAYMERLSSSSQKLVPAEPGAGSARHLNSVLHAVSCLLKNRKRGAIPPA